MGIIETLQYQSAEIVGIFDESPRTKTFRIKPAQPFTFLAGQHTIVRVALPDGFKTSRHYSFSSAPSSGYYDITIAKTHDGVVSSWFCDQARVGDMVDLTQPLGTMTWQIDSSYPTVLIGGGVGIAPLISIFREHQLQKSSSEMTLVYSARNYEELCFKQELLDAHKEKVMTTLVDSVPGDWQGHSGVIHTAMVKPFISHNQRFYICGPYGFVQHVKSLLTGIGILPESIKVENFTLQ